MSSNNSEVNSDNSTTFDVVGASTVGADTRGSAHPSSAHNNPVGSNVNDTGVNKNNETPNSSKHNSQLSEEGGGRSRTNSSARDNSGDAVSELTDKMKDTSIDSGSSTAPTPFKLAEPVKLYTPPQLPLPQLNNHYQGNQFRGGRGGEGQQSGRGGGGGFQAGAADQRHPRGGGGGGGMAHGQHEYPPPPQQQQQQQRGGRGGHHSMGGGSGRGGASAQGRGGVTGRGGRGGRGGGGGSGGGGGDQPYYPEDRNHYDYYGQQPGYYDQHQMHQSQQGMYNPQPQPQMVHQQNTQFDQYGRPMHQNYQQRGGRGHPGANMNANSGHPGSAAGTPSPAPHTVAASPGGARSDVSDSSPSPGVDQVDATRTGAVVATEGGPDRPAPAGVAVTASEGAVAPLAPTGPPSVVAPNGSQGQPPQTYGRQQAQPYPNQSYYSPTGGPGGGPIGGPGGGPIGGAPGQYGHQQYPPQGAGRHHPHQHMPSSPVVAGVPPVPPPHMQQGSLPPHAMRGGYGNYPANAPVAQPAVAAVDPSSPVVVHQGSPAAPMGMPVGMAPGNIAIPPVLPPGVMPVGGTPTGTGAGKLYGNQPMLMGSPVHTPSSYGQVPVSAPPKKKLEIKDKDGNVVELPQKTPKVAAPAPVPVPVEQTAPALVAEASSGGVSAPAADETAAATPAAADTTEEWEKEDVNVIIASGQSAVKSNSEAVLAPPGLEHVDPASATASASAQSAGIATLLSSAPGIITIPTSGSGARSKGKLLKSKLAEADSKGSQGDMLDAYTTATATATATVDTTGIVTGAGERASSPISAPAPAVNHTIPRAPVNFKSGSRISPSVSASSLTMSASSTPSIPASPSPNLPPGIATPGAGEEGGNIGSNWGDNSVTTAGVAAGAAATVPKSPSADNLASTAPVTVTPVAPGRRELRPSGAGLSKIASSRGSPAIPAKPVVKITYSKEEILNIFAIMSAQGKLEAPTPTVAERYAFQVETVFDGASSGRPVASPSHGLTRSNSTDHGDLRRNPGMNPPNSSGFNKGGGDAWKRQDASVTAQQAQQMGNPNQQGRPRNVRGQRNAGPAPRRVITDPVEQLKRDVKAILNKITPQTFTKLSQQLCDMNLPTVAMLDTMIHEIFEKAVDEPKFCQIYAETCFRIDEVQKSKLPAFLQIVHDRDAKTYAWVRDLDLENVNAAGPYRDESECLAAAASVTPPVTAPLDNVCNNIEPHKFIISNQVLHKLFRNTDTEAFYVSFCPASEINHLLGDKAFTDAENARADAVKLNTLKRKIVLVCHQEYENATSREGFYQKHPVAEEKFHADVAAGVIVKGADDYEYETRESDLEFLRIKTKNRMMGNIRFVGELYKMKLVPAGVMYGCITEILLTRDADGEYTEWKVAPDDAEIELLCHLLRTVGKMLDESCKDDQMDMFFQRLLHLSQDKQFSSRMRFGMIEIIELRLSNWIERHVVEKPQTIEEIHAAAAAEEKGGVGGKGPSNPNLRLSAGQKHFQGGGDFRSQGGKNQGPGYSPSISKKNQNQNRQGQPRTIMKNPDSQGQHPAGTTVSSVGAILDKYKSTARKGKGNSNNNSNNAHNKDRTGSTGGGSPPPGPEQAAQSSIVSFLQYDRDVLEDLKGTITSIIRDYLKGKDEQNAKDRIEEEGGAHPPNIFGVQFMLTFIEFSMDCKVSEQEFLLSWLTRPDTLLTKYFVQGNADMAAALAECGTVLYMPDSMSDFKNAPEWIGSILAHLVRIKACDLNAALATVDKCLTSYLEDEFSDHDGGNAAYVRLKTAISKP